MGTDDGTKKRTPRAALKALLVCCLLVVLGLFMAPKDGTKLQFRGPPAKPFKPVWTLKRQQRKRTIAYIDVATSVHESLKSSGPLKEAVWADKEMETMGETLERQNFDTFLIETSNPIRRAMYAYNRLHTSNTTTAYNKDEKRMKFYGECYPTLASLLQGIHQIFQQVAPAQNTTLTDCQKMALRVLKGGDPSLKMVNEYLFYNTGFYWANSIHKHPFLDVFVVRTEVIWDDLASLDEKFLGDTKAFKNKDPVPDKYVYSPTKEQAKQLCCILWQELDYYQQLLDRAQNLNNQDKEGTIIDLIDTCSIVSDQENIETNDVEQKSILRDGYGVNWPIWYKRKCPNLESVMRRRRRRN